MDIAKEMEEFSPTPTLDPRPKRRLDRGMKPILFSVFVALLMVGWGESSQPSESAEMNDTAPKKEVIETAVDLSKLQDRNGVWFLPNEVTPFTGLAQSFYENGQKKLEFNWKDGKQDGLATKWYESGQKKSEGSFKDGKPDGSLTFWDENSQKKLEGSWKDGKLHGLLIVYNKDGTEKVRSTYKDGEKVED